MAKADQTKTDGGDGKGGQAAPADRRTVAPTPDYGAGPAGNGASGGTGGRSGDDDSMLDTAKERATSEAQNARETAAETARERAERVREAGEAFEEDSYAREATDAFADRIDQAARTIRDADLGGMADDLADFARRQPLVFFGGAALLGFAAARMLKASERADHAHDRRSYRSRIHGAEPRDDDPWRTA